MSPRTPDYASLGRRGAKARTPAGLARSLKACHAGRVKQARADREARRPPRGHASVPALLQAVRVALAERPGSKADLARRLGVARRTLYEWLTGQMWPRQGAIDALGRWLRNPPRKELP